MLIKDQSKFKLFLYINEIIMRKFSNFEANFSFGKN